MRADVVSRHSYAFPSPSRSISVSVWSVASRMPRRAAIKEFSPGDAKLTGVSGGFFSEEELGSPRLGFAVSVSVPCHPIPE